MGTPDVSSKNRLERHQLIKALTQFSNKQQSILAAYLFYVLIAQIFAMICILV